jgi:hypothetical protein
MDHNQRERSRAETVWIPMKGNQEVIVNAVQFARILGEQEILGSPRPEPPQSNRLRNFIVKSSTRQLEISIRSRYYQNPKEPGTPEFAIN